MSEIYTPEIIASNPEQHGEGIEKQLTQLQILFCDRLYQQYRNECRKNGKPIEKTFSDILEKQEAYYAGDLRMSVTAQSAGDLNDGELSGLVAKKHYVNVNKLYDKLPEAKTDDNSPEYLRDRAGELKILTDYSEAELERARNEFPDKWREMHERPKNEEGQIENRAGIIDFNSLKEPYIPDISQIEAALRKEGFSELDGFLQIHLPSQFGAETKINPRTIKESLTSLAEKIIDKHPETHAVIAVSWLLSHPIFQRFIKMKIIGEGSINWRQLIGNNGQIEQARVKEFFSTGRMPYRNLIGYIPVEKFLQEYLPAERRGESKLNK